jgi:hypothetical protein
MPGDPGATVVTNARAFYTTRAAAGASGTRHSPRPPFRGEGYRHNSGAWRRGNAKLQLAVITSEAKQSILSLRDGLDCFASLAMTLLRCGGPKIESAIRATHSAS